MSWGTGGSGGGGSSSTGWVRDAGAGTVTLFASTDGVGIGATPVATSKFIIAGNASRRDIECTAGANGNVSIGANGTGQISFSIAPGGVATTVATILNSGGFLARRSVSSPSPPGPTVLDASLCRRLLTDQNGMTDVTLPSATDGLEFHFYFSGTEASLTITAAAGDTIRIGPNVSSSGGTATTTAEGSYLALVAINDTEWVAQSMVGTWTLA